MLAESVQTSAGDWIIYAHGRPALKGLDEATARAVVDGWDPPPRKERNLLEVER